MSRNIKLLTFLCTFLMAAWMLSACGGNNPAPAAGGGSQAEQPQTQTPENNGAAAESWTVKHELGEETFSAIPQKIVVLDMYLLDIATGLGVQPVGVAAESLEQQQLPEHLKTLVNYDFTWVGARNEPSLEIIASLQPDLIIADLNRHKEAYTELKKLAPTLVVSGSGAEDWLTIITMLGEALQMPEEAEAAIEAYEGKLATGKEALTAADASGKKVLPITLYPDQKVRIYTADSYTGKILADLGLELPYTANGKPFEEVQAEALLDIETDDYILIQSPVYTKDIDSATYPIFKDLEQVKLGNTHTVSMEDWAFYRGPVAANLIIDETVELFGR